MDSSRGRIWLIAITAALAPSTSFAVDGTWINSTGGDYNSGGNWQGGVIANGADATADFSTLDLPGDISINIGSSRTLGHLIFGDTNLASPATIEVSSLSSPISTVTLAGTSPTITVNELAPTTFDDVYFAPYLSGTNGFTKLGAGILTLAGVADTGFFVGNNISGTVTIAEGTLRIDAGFSYYDLFNLVDPQAQTIDEFHLQDGGTLELGSIDLANPNGVTNATVAAGATATVRGFNGAFVNGLVGGAGSTLNVDVGDSNAGGADTFSTHGDWSGFATVNVTGNSGIGQPLDNFRLRPNGGGFNTNSFSGSVVNLDNVRTFVRSNSNGNTINIAELHGTATAEISGGSNPGGVARWSIGANNNDSTHAGTITPSDGGLDLIKVGTGTLTLSGELTYSPVNTAEGGQAGNPDRRGGITTITAGTLALTGAATLPAGTDDTGALGLLYSTVDIAAGATLDVSGSSGYSTAALQQVIGNGSIAGNYIHDEGRLAPGDDNVGNSATLVRTPGTLTFEDSVTFNGGEILFDLSDTPAGPIDLIQVNGATTNLGSGGLVTPNFLGDVPTSGQYTILTSANGFTGNTSGWSVAWPGRGGSLPVNISGNDLVFDAAATTGASIVWRGNLSANWDVQTTSNWTNGGSPDQFFNGDDVTFNDTATQFNVNVPSDVQPLSITVNASTDYTIGGAGRIIGFASLTKQGSGMLTLTQNNTYTGPTSIESGTVDIGVFVGALGSGQLTMSGATLRASNAVTGGMTNSSLVVSAGTSNTIVSNGEPTNPATNPLGLPSTTGAGDLTVTTEVEGRLIDLGASHAGFTGTLTIAPTGPATAMGVRFSGAADAGLPDGTLYLAAGATVNQRQNNAQTVAIGALEGEAGSFLSGFAGGGTAPVKSWRIGDLGTSTTFAGDVIDGGAATNLIKAGDGTLTLTGANTYTGDTTVEDGVLSIVSAYLADTADVYILPDGTFNLDFAGTDTIDSLFFNGASQAVGTWGGIGSGATNQVSWITGSGILDVLTFEGSGLVGDYNNDGSVDAADYTVWRDGGPLQNETASPGVVDAADYTAWAGNYGAVAAAGTAVPEPTSVMAALLAITCGLAARRRVAG